MGLRALRTVCAHEVATTLHHCVHYKPLQLSVADVDAILIARLAPVIPVPESPEEYPRVFESDSEQA